jgi:uncharacterized protein YbjQ (UPF0145 family)
MAACAAALAGCATCIVVQSEYYDTTGQVIAPKAEDRPVEILEQRPDRPYQEIGVVKVLARRGTAHAHLNKEMIDRARSAGADAIIGVEYAEDTSGSLIFCGRVVSTKKNVSAVGKAIVFTPHPVPPSGGTGGIPPHGGDSESQGATGVIPRGSTDQP